jgi:hypothetical protein
MNGGLAQNNIKGKPWVNIGLLRAIHSIMHNHTHSLAVGAFISQSILVFTFDAVAHTTFLSF